MHTFFLLSALLFAAALSCAGALLLRITPATERRALAIVTLTVPPVVLVLAATHLIPQLWLECAPLVGWDRVASFALLGSLSAVALGALAMAGARLVLIERLVHGCPPLLEPALLARAASLAHALHTAAPRVRVLPLDSPVAVSAGLLRPTVVVSSWLLEHLDERELEAVLSHELAHIARRDVFIRWLARFLRDATIFLPGSWYAVGVLEADEELIADAVAVGATQRRLAMASALGKVWHSVISTPRPVSVAGVPAYTTGSAELLEERLNRLLDDRTRPRRSLGGRLLAAASVVSVGEVAPRLLSLSATALPLMCTLRY